MAILAVPSLSMPRTGSSACRHLRDRHNCQPRVFGREDVDESFGPASVVFRRYGRRVGAGTWSDLLSGLTPRVGCLETGSSPGSQSLGTYRRCRSDLPGLGKRPGFHRSAASGCVPSLNHREKGTAMTIVEDTCVITGGVDT